MNFAPRFLSVDDIIVLHAIAIEDQGGDSSIRDQTLLESAVSTPAQQFEGQYLHVDISSMAAAYAFHICMNHPFIDGNKRAGVAAMIAFLSDNGWSFDASADDAEPVILQLAAGAMDKQTFTDWARKHMHEKPKMELREFFKRIDASEFEKRFLSLLPAITQTTQQEFSQRFTEALPAMPLLGSLAKSQIEAKKEGNIRGYEHVSMLAIGMITLFALAEDMGYEW